MALAWIAGGLGLASGIFGAVGQSQQNKSQQNYYDKLFKQQKKQNRINKRQINRDNRFNAELWRFENAQGQRQADWARKDAITQFNNLVNQNRYADQIDMRQWQYTNKMLTFEYQNQVKQYKQSEKNYGQQLQFNNIAAAQAYESERNARMEIGIAQAFQSQDIMVDQVLAEGQIKSRGQAGNSAAKAVQANLADYGRSLAKMDASIRSADRQHMLNLQKISVEKLGADLAAEAARMIKPEMPPQMPKPLPRPVPELNLPLDWVKTPKPPRRISTQVAPVRQTVGGGAGWSMASNALSGIGSMIGTAYSLKN